MEKVIVTGANGFVGSNLVRELVDQGFFVYAIVRNMKSNVQRLDVKDNISVLHCSLDEIDSLSYLKDQKIKFFFHFAWDGTSGDARGECTTQLNNAKYTCEAVKVAAKLGCARFINAGSIMEYEAKQYLSNAHCKPGRGYIYSTAKLTADYMAKIEAINSGIEYCNCLISNIYGAGEYSQRFINTTIRKMILGERLSFTKGNQKYDFIYVTDAVKAIVLIAISGLANSEYYIGNRNLHFLKDYIYTMRNLLAPDSPLYLGEVPYNGVYLNYSEIDVERLWREFNFVPQIGFEKGIQLTKEWITENEKF